MSKKDSCGPRWAWARDRHARFAPPWARDGASPFAGGRPGRMFAQGDLRLLLLALIADKPSHGYDLIRAIEARFGGAYAPSPGAVYPTLTLLEEQDLIAAEDAGGRKTYRATPQGLEHLAGHEAQLRDLMTRVDIMAGSGATPPDSVLRAVAALRLALLTRSGAWTSAEEERVRAVLERAARDVAGP